MVKISAKLLKTARTLYVYADGHGVMVHEKTDRDAGRVEWVTLHEKLPCEVQSASWLVGSANRGRLIVSGKGAIAKVLSAKAIAWAEASIERGSENTKKAGLAFDMTAMDFGGGWTWVYGLPGMLSSDITPQPDCHGRSVDGTWQEHNAKWLWGDAHINARYDAEGNDCERKELETA